MNLSLMDLLLLIVNWLVLGGAAVAVVFFCLSERD